MNKEDLRENISIVILMIVIIIIIFILLGINRGNGNQTPPSGPPSGPSNGNNNSQTDFMQIAGMQIPVAMSFVNQEAGKYTYCGTSDMSDTFTENEINYRASKNFKTLDELKQHLKRILTDDLIKKYLATDKNAYIEKDNKLYCSYTSADSLNTVFISESAIETVDNPEFTIANETQTNFDATLSFKYENTLVKYTFNFINENNNWLINSYTYNN